MNYDDLDERFKDVTFNHYVAHNMGDISGFEKNYYCIIPKSAVSTVEVSVFANDWMVLGIIDLLDGEVKSKGDRLIVSPVDQNNMRYARADIYKNSEVNRSLTNDHFINQVLVNIYQQNKVTLGLASNRNYFIEVKNTHRFDVYYNINIRFADGIN